MIDIDIDLYPWRCLISVYDSAGLKGWCENAVTSNQPAFFGNGTKLTVLGKYFLIDLLTVPDNVMFMDLIVHLNNLTSRKKRLLC